jgi:glycosyltransferase involved in cell wall biosynthesis
MKLLFISSVFYPKIGGIEVNSEILVRGFVHLGADVHLLTNTETSKISDDNDRFPFKVIRKPNNLILLKEFLWADVVFENHLTLRMSWPLFFLKKKYVIAIRTWLNKAEGVWNMLEKLKRWRLTKANAVIAVSEIVRQLTFDKSIVIGNPYRSELFTIKNNVEKKDFVFLGRLVSDKGCDMAIKMLHLLHQNKKHKCNLTIIGDGNEMDNLKDLVNEYELNDYISFTGNLRGEELVKCLNKHKYLLVPSRWREPFGNVALEGMACGCLPFVSDGSGLVDAVGNAGIVFERNNIQSMYNEIEKFLNNSDLEQKIRNNVENHLKKHSQEYVVNRYYEVIQNII